LVSSWVRDEAAGHLGAALIDATFEAWMQWAAGPDPDTASFLVVAVGVLRASAA